MSPDERTPRLYHASQDAWTAGDATLTFLLAVATFLAVPMFGGAELTSLVAAEAIGLALVPVLVIRVRRLPLATLGLVRPDRRALLGALLVGVAIWYVAAWITAPWAHWLRDDGEAVKPLEQMLERTPIAALIAITFVPAICEEIAMRGLLALGLRPRLGAILAVAISAAAFALMHMSLVRAVPTAILGVTFATMAVRSRSVVPSMIAHALNNGIALLVTTGRAAPVERAIADHPDLAAVAAAALVVGGLGIARTKRN
jgi:membrane protease YdiL (CAAX protease family)